MELLKIITITFWLFWSVYLIYIKKTLKVKTWNTTDKTSQKCLKIQTNRLPMSSCLCSFLSGLSFNILFLFHTCSIYPLLSIILHIIFFPQSFFFFCKNFSTSETPSNILSKLRHLHLLHIFLIDGVLLWMHFIATRSRWP